MNNKALINSGNISSKVLVTNKNLKYIEEPEQLQWNRIKIKKRVSSNNINNNNQ